MTRFDAFLRRIPFRDDLAGGDELTLEQLLAGLLRTMTSAHSPAELDSGAGPASKRTFEAGGTALVLDPADAEALASVFAAERSPALLELLQRDPAGLGRIFLSEDSALTLTDHLGGGDHVEKYGGLRHENTLVAEALARLDLSAALAGEAELADVLRELITKYLHTEGREAQLETASPEPSTRGLLEIDANLDLAAPLPEPDLRLYGGLSAGGELSGRARAGTAVCITASAHAILESRAASVAVVPRTLADLSELVLADLADMTMQDFYYIRKD